MKSIFFFLLGSLALVFISCSNDSSSQSSDSICTGVLCSNHGECAISTEETAICVCDKGYYTSEIGTECIPEGSSDPCDGVNCSNHGNCAIDDGVAICTCDDGYSVQGLSCIAESSTEAFFAVPTYISLSKKGGYSAYIDMELLPDTNGRYFKSGDFLLRNNDTQLETVIEPSIEMISDMSGTYFPTKFYFDELDKKMIYYKINRDITTSSSPGIVIDIATGDTTPLGNLAPYETMRIFDPNLDWVLSAKQTYSGNYGALRLMKPLTAAPQLIAESCRDPHPYVEFDGITVGATTYIAFSSCTREGNATNWSLKIYENPSNGVPVEIAPVQTKKIYARPNGIVYQIEGTSSDEVYYVPFTGGSPIFLGEGMLNTVSPDGIWVVITHYVDGIMTGSLVKYDSSEEIPIVSLLASAWAGDNILYFTTYDNLLKRSVNGSEPEELGIEATEIHSLPNERVWVSNKKLGSGDYYIVIKDNNDKAFSVSIPSMHEAFIVDSNGIQALGLGTFWQVSSENVLRGDFYYDVLNGGIPGPENGFYIYTP